MIRPTVARVDLSALKSNYRHIVERLPREQPANTPGVIAVVKANAYGHGAAEIARALEDAGADLLACADIEEGAALRTAGVRAGILVFGALSVSDLDGLFDCRLTPTISPPGAPRAVQGARPLSPEDRYRHEPARVSLRQPAPHAARAPRERESGARCRVHAFRQRRRSGEHAVRSAARALPARPERARGARRPSALPPRRD